MVAHSHNARSAGQVVFDDARDIGVRHLHPDRSRNRPHVRRIARFHGQVQDGHQPVRHRIADDLRRVPHPREDAQPERLVHRIDGIQIGKARARVFEHNRHPRRRGDPRGGPGRGERQGDGEQCEVKKQARAHSAPLYNPDFQCDDGAETVQMHRTS